MFSGSLMHTRSFIFLVLLTRLIASKSAAVNPLITSFFSRPLNFAWMPSDAPPITILTPLGLSAPGNLMSSLSYLHIIHILSFNFRVVDAPLCKRSIKRAAQLRLDWLITPGFVSQGRFSGWVASSRLAPRAGIFMVSGPLVPMLTCTLLYWLPHFLPNPFLPNFAQWSHEERFAVKGLRILTTFHHKRAHGYISVVSGLPSASRQISLRWKCTPSLCIQYIASSREFSSWFFGHLDCHSRIFGKDENLFLRKFF